MEITLGQRIGMLRKQKGLRQDDVAEQLGVSPQAVSKWENDQTCPDITLLPELAGILGVTVDELLCGKQEPLTRLVPAEERKDPKDMILRISVDSGAGDVVRVNLPIPLVQVALEVGIAMPEIGGNDALKKIDLAKILELVDRGAIGNLVEIESSSGEHVRIFVE